MAKKKPQEISEEIGGTSMQEAAEITSGIPMYQKTPSDLAIPNEFKIGNQVLNKQTLIKQRDADVQLTIKDISDTKGYNLCVEKRRQYRTIRTTLEKIRKEMSAPIQEKLKKLKETTDDLGKEAFIGEDYFDSLITAYDNEKERIRQEKEAERQRIIQGRVTQLIGYGATFDGNEYVFPYDTSMNVSAMYVKETTDENWADDIKVVQEAFALEQERIESERQQAEQDALVAQQQKEETELLIQQQAEANEVERKNLLEQRTAMRVKELTKLHGFVLGDDDRYTHVDKPHKIKAKEIETAEDGVWDIVINTIETYEEPKIIPEPLPQFVDILGMATELNEATTSEINTVERFLNFDDTHTSFDIYISLKKTVRLFFVEYKDVALTGCDIEREGNYQGLHWAIIKT